MKYIQLFLLLSFAPLIQAQQETFVNPTNEWYTISYNNFGPEIYFSKYRFSDSTVVLNEKKYYELLKQDQRGEDNWSGLELYYRQKERKVYWYEKDKKEHLIYDFGLSVGDSIYNSFCEYFGDHTNPIDSVFLYVKSIDSILLSDGTTRKVFTMRNAIDEFLIKYNVVEDIGSTIGPFSAYYGCPITDVGTNNIRCFSQNGSTVFKNVSYPCDSTWTRTATESIAHLSIPYPNPVSKEINFDPLTHAHSYIIYDINGKALSSGKFRQSINVSDLKSGIYLLQLISTDRVQSFKIMKN